MSLISPTHSPAQELERVAGELRRLIARIGEAATVARGLADHVDWQSKTATTFHDRATAWAGEVSGMGCVAEAALHDAQRARDRAMFAESLPDGLWGAR